MLNRVPGEPNQITSELLSVGRIAFYMRESLI